MHHHSPNHSQAPQIADNPLLYASLKDDQLTDVVDKQFLVSASVDQIDGLISRVMKSASLRNKFTQTCAELFQEVGINGFDVPNRIIQAFTLQAYRLSNSKHDTLVEDVEPLFSIMSTAWRGANPLMSKQDAQELDILLCWVIRCGEKLAGTNEPGIWNPRQVQAVLQVIEQILTIAPATDVWPRTNRKQLSSFLHLQMTLSPQPTIETVERLETLFRIVPLLEKDQKNSFVEPLFAVLETLTDVVCKERARSRRKRLGSLSSDQELFSFALERGHVLGLETFRQLRGSSAYPELWEGALKKGGLLSDASLIALPEFLINEPIWARPYLERCIKAVSNQKLDYLRPLCAALCAETGVDQVRSIISSWSLAARGRFFDHLDQHLNRIEHREANSPYLVNWKNHYLPAVEPLRRLLHR